MNEEKKHQLALEVYQNMGINRSYRKLETLTGCTRSTLNRWAHDFNWDEKVREFDSKSYSPADQQKALDGLILRFKHTIEKSIDPHERIIGTLMEQCGIILKTGFEKDEKTGLIVPKFEIRNVKDYVAILGAIRDLIELLRKDRGGKGDGGTGKKNTTNIENLLVMLGDADESTQRGFITASDGATVGKRTQGVAGTPQEADFEEVPDADDAQD